MGRSFLDLDSLVRVVYRLSIEAHKWIGVHRNLSLSISLSRLRHPIRLDINSKISSTWKILHETGTDFPWTFDSRLFRNSWAPLNSYETTILYAHIRTADCRMRGIDSSSSDAPLLRVTTLAEMLNLLYLIMQFTTLTNIAWKKFFILR